MQTILSTVIGLLFSTFTMADCAHDPQEIVADFKTAMPVVGKTGKGIKTWLISDADTPMVSIIFSFKNGKLLDAVGKEGLSRLYKDLLLGDRVEYKSQDVSKRLDNIQSYFDVYQNNNYFFVETRFPIMHIEEFQHIVKGVLINSNFTRSSFDKSRNYLSSKSGIAYESAYSLASDLLREKLYPDHIFSSSNRAGIPSISLKEVQNYAVNHFSKDDAHVTAVGNITPQQLEAFIDDLIGDFPQEKRVKSRVVDAPTLPSVPGVFHIEKDENQSVIAFGRRCPAVHHPDWAAIKVLEAILGKGHRSRLMKTLRNKLGLCYTPESKLTCVSNDEAFLNGAVVTDQENTQQAVDALFSIFQELHSKEIKESQLEDVKSELIEQLTLSMTSTLASASELEVLYRRDLGPNGLEKVKNSLKNVTLGDINRVANIYFDPAQFTVICVGPVAPLNPLLKEKPGSSA